jgi:secondary thiamine-phosphate synthase enzyme
MSLSRISIKTRLREEFVNITSLVKKAISESGIKDGLCVVYVPHTTAAITINESADSDVVRDVITRLSTLVPHSGDYHHSEGNSDAHIKSSIIGNSRVLIVENGNIVLGTWEGIFFCEFDGPRTRQVYVKVINC